MSDEESYRHRTPCPCGEGEYEVVGYTSDWGSSRIERTMLCPRCAPSYVWSATSLGGHQWNERERGWVRRSVLEAEARYSRDVTARLREALGARWREIFASARTKKAKWELLTVGGKGYPALGTFYQHTKGFDEGALAGHVDEYLAFHHLGRVAEICRVRAADFGVRDDTVCDACGGGLTVNARGDQMCRVCLYIRPRPGF